MKGLFQRTQGPIARGTIRTSFVLGLRLAVQAGTLLLVARMLGPREFGAFAGVAALAVILGSLATFGTSTMLLAAVSEDPARREQVLCYALPITLLCGGALLVVYLVIAMLALGHTGVPVTVLIAIGATETLLQSLLRLCTAEHHGLGRIARSQLLTVLPLGLRLAAAAAVFLLHLAHPLAAYGYAYPIASALALGVAAAVRPGRWPATRTWRLPQRRELRETIGYAVISITRTGPAELDKTLATRLLPLASAGVYAAGARVIGAITLPVTAMTLSALPRLFREARDQHRRTNGLLRWMFGAAFGYSLALAGILWLIAPVFDWIFGDRYHGVVQVIRWLCIVVPGIALRLTAGNILMAIGKPWMRVGFEACGLFVLVVASVLLVSRMNSVGMPLALACSEWAMALGGIALIQATMRRQELGTKQDRGA